MNGDGMDCYRVLLYFTLLLHCFRFALTKQKGLGDEAAWGYIWDLSELTIFGFDR